MSKTCYCICFIPETYPTYINSWKYFKDKENSFILVDNSGNHKIDYKSFIFTESEIRNNFNFPHNVSPRHFWNSMGNKNIIWFYAYLRMINFYISNPNYDYYWFFDDDVYCENWDEFLKGFELDDSDFLSYFLFKKDDVETYPNIPKIDNRTYSKNSWFNRFPGDQDTLEEGIINYFGSFFAIVRFSNKSLKELVRLTKEGYYGYGEGFVPTEFSKLNLKMNTIFRPENTSNYFNNDITKILHKNQKITWEWI